MEFGFEPVCDQLRTSFEPASVMEFGFYGLSILDTTHLQSAQKKNNALFFCCAILTRRTGKHKRRINFFFHSQ